MTFKSGQSGNPKGKPKGALSRTVRLKNRVLDALELRWFEVDELPIIDLLNIAARFVPKEVAITHGGEVKNTLFFENIIKKAAQVEVEKRVKLVEEKKVEDGSPMILVEDIKQTKS